MIYIAFKVGMHRSDTQYRYRLRYWHFLPDQVSVKRDRSKSDIVRILSCVIVKPHERHKIIIKHHKVSVHYISSVLKPFNSLMWGTDEYSGQVDVNSSLRCVCLSSSIQTLGIGRYSDRVGSEKNGIVTSLIQSNHIICIMYTSQLCHIWCG